MTDTKLPVRRIIIWETTLLAMRQAGVEYGASFSKKWMEDHLGCAWNTIEFNGAVHEIRCQLELEGRYLSARGQGEAGYTILMPQENAAQGQRNQRLALSLLRRTVNLLSTTPLDGLTAEEKRLHEGVLERSVKRLSLIERTLPKIPTKSG